MFQIYFQDKLIGHSKLEHGDPPMGVAHGEFLPTDNFEKTKDKFEYLKTDDMWRLENFVLRTSEGTQIECHSGTVILAFESLENPFYLQFTALGIGYPVYENLFPQHVKMYKEQFSS